MPPPVFSAKRKDFLSPVCASENDVIPFLNFLSLFIGTCSMISVTHLLQKSKPIAKIAPSLRPAAAPCRRLLPDMQIQLLLRTAQAPHQKRTATAVLFCIFCRFTPCPRSFARQAPALQREGGFAPFTPRPRSFARQAPALQREGGFVPFTPCPRSFARQAPALQREGGCGRSLKRRASSRPRPQRRRRRAG